MLGVLSDRLGLQTALTLVPLFCIVAAYLFRVASRTYVADTARAASFAHAE